jgi:hypothetical protein
MIHGYNLFWDRLDYQVAVSSGEINGDEDTNELKDLVCSSWGWAGHEALRQVEASKTLAGLRVGSNPGEVACRRPAAT